MPKELNLSLDKGGRRTVRKLSIDKCIIAGWASRDEKEVRKHIAELETLGVKAPSSVPLFYETSTDRVTTEGAIEVLGENSSGEVEFVLLQHDRELWVGVGSDHTDRVVEAYSVAVSKQLCDKPIAPTFWSFADVKDHWDEIKLQSHIQEAGARVLYQAFDVTSLLAPAGVIAKYCNAAAMPEGALMFCGTAAALGGVRPSADFEFSLIDPRLNRTIAHRYAVRPLKVVQ